MVNFQKSIHFKQLCKSTALGSEKKSLLQRCLHILSSSQLKITIFEVSFLKEVV